MDRHRIAIIDLGTNTFHLLTATLSDRSVQITDREKITVKIGEGGINRSRLTRQARMRAVEAVRRFKEIINEKQVHEIQAFATSAIRTASNGRDLLREIYESTGIEVKILSGSQEAQFIFNGVKQAVDLGSSMNLVMDIGGGSVEFAIGNAYDLVWKKSFEIGAQRLLYRFHKHDPVLPSDLRRLNKYLEKELKPLVVAASKYRPGILIGSSGTFDTLSEIYNISRNIRRGPSLTEVSISLRAFFETYEEIVARNREDRLAIPGMAESRVDMIVMSVALIHFVVTRLGIAKIKSSAYSLKEGILYSLVEKRQEKKLSA